MKQKLVALLRSQVIRFLFAGGIAAIANYGSRFLYSDLGLSYAYAIVLAYLTGMAVAFVLMRSAVFDATRGDLKNQAIRFAGVNLFAIIQTLVISLLLARWGLPALGITQHAEAIAHLVGVIVPVVTSYFGHKWFTFK